ncbi:MAG: hypothetical protein ACRC0X_10280 [Brevinema sp.]
MKKILLILLLIVSRCSIPQQKEYVYTQEEHILKDSCYFELNDVEYKLLDTTWTNRTLPLIEVMTLHQYVKKHYLNDPIRGKLYIHEFNDSQARTNHKKIHSFHIIKDVWGVGEHAFVSTSTKESEGYIGVMEYQFKDDKIHWWARQYKTVEGINTAKRLPPIIDSQGNNIQIDYKIR